MNALVKRVVVVLNVTSVRQATTSILNVRSVIVTSWDPSVSRVTLILANAIAIRILLVRSVIHVHQIYLTIHTVKVRAIK